MTRSWRPLFASLPILLGVACGRAADTAVPVATPTVTVSRPEALVGGPLEMTYRFAVSPSAPAFADDYWVFVHFLDVDGELMWTDDHEPPTPTRQWKQGATIEYTRTMFVPKFPYVGETRVEVGLFSRRRNERLPLNATTRGQRSYQVSAFNLQLQSDSLFVVFKDGWHATEQAEGSAQEWQWSKKLATLAFRNPRHDATLYLHLDRGAGFPEPQQVELRIGDAAIDSFALAPAQAEMRKVKLSAAQLGSGDTVEVQVSVDRTFIPATVPALKSADQRELGVRVFRAFVEAR